MFNELEHRHDELLEKLKVVSEIEPIEEAKRLTYEILDEINLVNKELDQLFNFVTK